MTAPVHFVGTIGLETSQEVFREVGQKLGASLRRLPDGEVAGRRMWISYQLPVLRSYGFLRPVGNNPFLPLGLAEDFDPSEARFAELGYAREARLSYQEFCAARDAGQVPQGVRFQVSLPTPAAVITAFLTPSAAMAVEEAYTQAMLREVAAIAQHVPHEDLAIQWDTCMEMIEWDKGGDRQGFLGDDPHTGITSRMARLSDAVPSDVQLGFHFCYGNLDGGDVELPLAPGQMIGLYHAIAGAADHSINWLHVPIPVQADEAFFAGFERLKLRPETDLFLGLIHSPDDYEGLDRRIRQAKARVPQFGVATRCGIARGRGARDVRSLLDAHAEAARLAG